MRSWLTFPEYIFYILKSPFRNTWEVSEENYGIKENFNLYVPHLYQKTMRKKITRKRCKARLTVQVQ